MPRWTPEQLIFMEWEVLPQSRRQHNQEQLAEALGVSDRTLRNWNNLPGWHEAKYKMAMWRLKRRMPDIINCLIKDLTSADGWQARKEFVRYGIRPLNDMDESGYLDEVKGAVVIPDSSVFQEHLASLTSDERQRFIVMLESLGLMQQEHEEVITKDYNLEKEFEADAPDTVIRQSDKRTPDTMKQKKQRYHPTPQLTSGYSEDNHDKEE